MNIQIKKERISAEEYIHFLKEQIHSIQKKDSWKELQNWSIIQQLV